jgi:hypothetical protein
MHRIMAPINGLSDSGRHHTFFISSSQPSCCIGLFSAMRSLGALVSCVIINCLQNILFHASRHSTEVGGVARPAVFAQIEQSHRMKGAAPPTRH